MYAIKKLLRGALLALAVATGASMLSATPGQASASSNCGHTISWDDDQIYVCWFCESDGECDYYCSDGSAMGPFDCE